MKKIKIRPFYKEIKGKVIIPGSKSITNRVFILAALSAGKAIVSNALESEDTQIMENALKKCGVKIIKKKGLLHIQGLAGKFKSKQDLKIFMSNSGTSMRFLSAFFAFRPGKTILYGKKRMHKRPIEILLQGLRGIGAEINSIDSNGCPPIEIRGKEKLNGGKISLSGKISSQFFSAILQIAFLCKNPVEILIKDKLVSRPYLKMTIELLKKFKIFCEHSADFKKIVIWPQTLQSPKKISIESDATSASYFLALPAIHGGQIEVGNIPKNSLQGDIEFIKVLQKMGCKITQKSSTLICQGPKKLKPLGKINLENIPDSAMTAAILAAFSDGSSHITGLSTLKDKETDRLEALTSQLKKIGVEAFCGRDFITINGNRKKMKAEEIETFDDHRMAMCFALVASAVKDVVILDPDCVNKTFPQFWEKLDNLFYQQEIGQQGA